MNDGQGRRQVGRLLPCPRHSRQAPSVCFSTCTRTRGPAWPAAAPRDLAGPRGTTRERSGRRFFPAIVKRSAWRRRQPSQRVALSAVCPWLAGAPLATTAGCPARRSVRASRLPLPSRQLRAAAGADGGVRGLGPPPYFFWYPRRGCRDSCAGVSGVFTGGNVTCPPFKKDLTIFVGLEGASNKPVQVSARQLHLSGHQSEQAVLIGRLTIADASSDGRL